MSDEERVEGRFHNKMWKLANESGEIELAARDGRELAYALLEHAPEGSAAEHLAHRWLESYGRDSHREARLTRRAAQ